jgi:hypothetical protein
MNGLNCCQICGIAPINAGSLHIHGLSRKQIYGCKIFLKRIGHLLFGVIWANHLPAERDRCGRAYQDAPVSSDSAQKPSFVFSD